MSVLPCTFNNQSKKQQTVDTTKSNRTNAFDIMRSRSDYLLSTPNTKRNQQQLKSRNRKPKPIKKLSIKKQKTINPLKSTGPRGERDHNSPTPKVNKHQKPVIYTASLNVLTLMKEENLTELINALKM